MKQLIINADDFGLHELINEGIIESHSAGCVTSTSIMACGKAFEQAIALAKQHPQLGVGVHLTLVGASPVARGNIHTLLNNDGMFFSNYQEFVPRFYAGLISPEHIEYELRCQMQKVTGRGVVISHIDTHQHLHILPGIQEIFVKIAREFNISKVRMPAEPLTFQGTSGAKFSRYLARTGLTLCSFYARRFFRKHGLAYPENFYGMLSGGSMSYFSLSNIIENLPEGVTEIMVHPGKDSRQLAKSFNWGYNWQAELDTLKNKEIMRTIHKDNIALINFRQLNDNFGKATA